MMIGERRSLTFQLITGGANTVNALTGMNTLAACFFMPVGIVIYTLVGGVRIIHLILSLHPHGRDLRHHSRGLVLHIRPERCPRLAEQGLRSTADCGYQLSDWGRCGEIVYHDALAERVRIWGCGHGFWVSVAFLLLA
jgi:hypothetical protein